MSEMIERVAKAMAEADKNPLTGGLVWDHMTDDDSISMSENRNYWRMLARAAIEAIQPKIDEMIETARDEGYDHGYDVCAALGED